MSDVHKLLARIDALQKLLACYRIGGTPSESLHSELDRTRADEHDIRDHLKDTTP